jgi:hypothetical protein
MLDPGGNVNRLLTLAAAALLFAACYVPVPKTGKAETLAQSWTADGAESLAVDITLGVGTLKLAGGAAGAAEAEVRYNIPDWKPVLTYEVKDALGRVDLSQPSSVVGVTWPEALRYEWNVRLSDSLPVRLSVELGVGKVELDLSKIDVSRLKLDAGVGEGVLDLSGQRRTDLQATIQAGVGKLTVILPSGTPVSVRVEGGIGNVEARGFARRDGRYVNDADTGPRTEVDIEAGVGKIELRLASGSGDSI